MVGGWDSPQCLECLGLVFKMVYLLYAIMLVCYVCFGHKHKENLVWLETCMLWDSILFYDIFHGMHELHVLLML